MQEERLISPSSNAQEASQERAIRPLSLTDYIGQAEVKKQMDIFISSYKDSHNFFKSLL